MKMFNKYANMIPYLYFIAVTIVWFTVINRTEGLTAFPILLFGIPFVWQILKPSKKLNFSLGITFICLSSYLIVASIANLFDITSAMVAKGLIIYGGIFLALNFVMSAWIIRNSYKHTF